MNPNVSKIWIVESLMNVKWPKCEQAMAEQGPTRDPSIPDQLLALSWGKSILNVPACHLWCWSDELRW